MLSETRFGAALQAELNANPLPSLSDKRLILRKAIETIQRVAGKLVDQLGPEAKDEIKKWALATYDAWDIPYVGGVIESWIKAQLRDDLERALDKVLRIGVQPGPSKAVWIGGGAGLGGLVLSVILWLVTGGNFGCPGPNPNPEPEPKPPVVVPEPPPVIVPPVAEKVKQLILVRESGQQSDTLARLVISLQGGKGEKWLAEQGLTLLGIVDPGEVNASDKAATLVAKWRTEFEMENLPLLLLLDANSKLIRKEPLPPSATLDTLIALTTTHAEASFADLPYVDCDFAEWQQFGMGDATDKDTFEVGEEPPLKGPEPKFGQDLPRGPPAGALPEVAATGDEPVFEDAIPLIPSDQWPTAIAAIDEAGGSLDLLVTRIFNQGQEGSCVSNATCQGHQIIQCISRGKSGVIDLAAISLYKRTGSGPNSGSMVSANMREIIARGVLPLDTPLNRERFSHVMPNTGWRVPMPAGWEQTAKLFRGHEVFDVRSFDGFITALLRGYPVVYGRDGHSICAVRPTYRSGRLYVKYANSWGNWGEAGFGYDSEAKIRSGANWAFALRTVVEPKVAVAVEPDAFDFMPRVAARVKEVQAEPVFVQAP